MKIKNFSQYNESAFQKENFYKHVKFRDKDLQYWLQFEDSDTFLSANATNEEIEEEVDIILETFETYNQDDNPAYVILNKETLKLELIALAKVLLTFTEKADREVLGSYASDFIKAGENWQHSNKLSDANNKSGLFES
jgi:hypothetical protein